MFTVHVLGSDGAAHGLAQVHTEFRGNCRSGRTLRHDPQSLLQAGVRRGRGHAGRIETLAAHRRECAGWTRYLIFTSQSNEGLILSAAINGVVVAEDLDGSRTRRGPDTLGG